ncbi:hypothetical protein QBC39DRAFT_421666, partial [Podospora conica]
THLGANSISFSQHHHQRFISIIPLTPPCISLIIDHHYIRSSSHLETLALSLPPSSILSLGLLPPSTMGLGTIFSDCRVTISNTFANTRSGGRNGYPGAPRRIKGAPRPVFFWRVNGILQWRPFIKSSAQGTSPEDDASEGTSDSPSWLQPWVKLDPYQLENDAPKDPSPASRRKPGAEKKTAGFSREVEVCVFDGEDKPKKVGRMPKLMTSLKQAEPNALRERETRQNHYMIAGVVVITEGMDSMDLDLPNDLEGNNEEEW